MATDFWPQEEGYIYEGAPVMMCVAGAAITENGCVKLSATTAGQVTVTESTTWGECIGVALRAVASGKVVPVAFGGIVKILADGTFALGLQVVSSAAGGNKVIDGAASANMSIGDGGSAHFMGTLLQASSDDLDEVLLLIGRW